MSEHVTDAEPYLLVEEVAARLGLPLSVLLRRVEAGDVPSQLVERDDGPHYALRLSDLGIEADASGSDDDLDDEPEGISVFDDAGSRGVERAIASAFNPGIRPEDDEEVIDIPDASAWRRAGAGSTVRLNAEQPEDIAASGTIDVAGQEQAAVTETVEAPGRDRAGETEEAWKSGTTWPARETATPAWSSRPLEPQQPPVWITTEPQGAAAEEEPSEQAEDAAPAAAVEPVVEASLPPTAAPTGAPEFHERRGAPSGGLIDATTSGPRTDVASMSLDARDLVAGLLDRWERTLEQRIYTEQRQRFQGELTARQNMVKQLQMELQTARAEHAAAQAEKDRLLAAKERELAERERDIADTKRAADEAARMSASASSRRRRWFRARGDD